MKLLRIDSSARRTGSHSRELGNVFEHLWGQRFPDSAVASRDLVDSAVSHIHDETITAMFSPPEQHSPEMRAALSISDTLISEVQEADALLLTVPMYNFGIPSALKAWIDHVSRIGHTFAYDGTNFTGLLTGKTAYVVVAYGADGYGTGGDFAAANFVEPYLAFLLKFLGFEQVHFFNVLATNADPAAVPTSKAHVRSQMQAALQS
ncbi:FMN-dependent NADH-azoreductase [Hydrogenophaga sp.]|uniref:FMN-dependent NADH-azoreductase n=1 Tax=Hydrogenophaga sp. TaxID=1904254 RepID=UPI00356AE034